ncbi:hypothetical protein [Jatrophihabitans sp. GAS493]|uniref:hypothetical protein n=1 Tax=Jatrophihabitans sp. GAS493 TaxID=1907575 RepID=UPI000BB7836B|nr:hypothetical protein [Jatrophihabitans sp. GAS493]
MEQNFTVAVRRVPQRALLSAIRYVHDNDAGSVMGDLLSRMRAAAPGLPGVDGCPFAIYHGEVSADSDGPMEIVRPIADRLLAQAAADGLPDVQVRTEPEHDEAFVALTLAQTNWPAQLPALDAIHAHLESLGRLPGGPPRQVMIADWRHVRADEPACLLSLPILGV